MRESGSLKRECLLPAPRAVNLSGAGAQWRKAVTLAKPMAILVHRGVLVIRNELGTRIARTDDCVLLEPGEWDLEAVPAGSGLGVEIQFIPFSLDFVGACFRDCPHLELALMGAANFQETGVYIQHSLCRRTRNLLQAGAPGIEPSTQTALCLIFNSMGAAILRFVRSNFYMRRWALQLLMERNVLRSGAAKYLAALYAFGPDRFRRDCVRYLGQSAQDWFLQRRMELAYVWLEHSECTIADVVKALGYETDRHFSRDFRRVHLIRPEKLARGALWRDFSHDEINTLMQPGWVNALNPKFFDPSPSVKEYVRPQGADLPAEKEENQNEELPDLEIPAVDQESIEKFWNRNLVDPRKFIPFPKDLPDLLLPAAA